MGGGGNSSPLLTLMILTVGTFDIPHMGHASFLRRLSELGDVVVGVLSDAFVAAAKGPPVYNERERLAAVRALGYQAVVIPGDPDRIQHPLELGGIDFLAVGLDWFGDKYLDRLGMTVDELQAGNVGLIFVPYTETISTSDIRKRLR